MADRTQWAAIAAEMLAGQRARPVRLQIEPSQAAALNRIANPPSQKRAQVKAARKQRKLTNG